jgi:hypothetical protein
MWENQQKQMGKIVTGNPVANAKLEEFMKNNPHLDFSKAKNCTQ